jgi:hypothetical protein
MKKLILLALLFGYTATAVVAQSDNDPLQTEETTPANGPKMEFEAMEVDYGTIEQHSEPLRSLSFTNTGTEPLVIKNARGSCGCTVPIWPKEPIMPGETSQIDIRYATNRLGKINKKVTLTTNEASGTHVIKVLGKVNKPEGGDAIPAATPNIISGSGK